VRVEIVRTHNNVLGKRRLVGDRRGLLPNFPDKELLSPSELDCVALYVRGLTFKEIARELGVRPKTIQAHLDHASTKLFGDYAIYSWSNRCARLIRHVYQLDEVDKGL
jgi:DNA-binding CsgD family transcriptional regulator